MCPAFENAVAATGLDDCTLFSRRFARRATKDGRGKRIKLRGSAMEEDSLSTQTQGAERKKWILRHGVLTWGPAVPSSGAVDSSVRLANRATSWASPRLASRHHPCPAAVEK